MNAKMSARMNERNGMKEKGWTERTKKGSAGLKDNQLCCCLVNTSLNLFFTYISLANRIKMHLLLRVSIGKNVISTKSTQFVSPHL